MPNSKKFSVLVYFLLFYFTSHSRETIRIACVGNSITYGAYIENREARSYPAQLSTLLGPGYDVRNFGKNGATLLRKGNLPYWETREYQEALKFQPDIVFIMLGTNDTKPVNRVYLNEYVNNYKELIASFRQAANKPRVVLLVPAPVFSKDSTGITASTLTELVVPMVRQVSYETGTELINMYNLLVESPQYFPDKVHPDAPGAAIIARRIYEFVRMQPDAAYGLLKAVPPDAKPFNFHGFQGFGFSFRSRDAKIVVPKRTSPGHPWVWRARFWGHEPQLDIALLERGFHIVYCDVAEMFGNEEALSIWNDYYQLLTRAGLAKKSVMEGMSRGGVYVYRWANAYPDRVAAIYADAPVMDLKSWPGGKQQSKGSPESWEAFKKDFNLKTEEEAMSFKGNPLDLTKNIAAAGFPMLHVVGDADDVVPVAENTAPFEQRIREAGGFIQVIHKPGVGHHPHSLQNPAPIVDFVLRATDYRAVQQMIPVPSPPQVRWHNYERIMFLHFAPNTWTGLGQDDNSLPLQRINPGRLDTDQWCRAAKSWGAKMIVFVAKHSGGFCWWQTNTTDYGVRNIPWKNGRGDLMAELSKSCTKYGLDMGVYIYPGDKSWGAGLGSGGRTKDPAKQEAYNQVFRQQLTEVLTKYKPMKEVWFDGSCVIDISDILQKHAADAVIFQGAQATIRWVGNEKGIAPYPNWYNVKSAELRTGNAHALHSDPEGDAYAPVEVDVPFLMNQKSYKWFWAPGTDTMLLNLPKLMDIYDRSVGRGSVLLLNATPDTTGLIPLSHIARYKAFGKALDQRFRNPLALVSGKGDVLVAGFQKAMTVNCAVISEDIWYGQRIRNFVLEGFSNGRWTLLKEGSSVGSKRIETFPPVSVSKLRLVITGAIATPVIKSLSIFNTGQSDLAAGGLTKESALTVGGWDNNSFTGEWQDLSIDLTPYLVEKVGQFELRFQLITHDRRFEKPGTGGYGLEIKDWKLETDGVPGSEAIKKTGDYLFQINNSQHISKQSATKIMFRSQVRSKPGSTVGTIELKMSGFE